MRLCSIDEIAALSDNRSTSRCRIGERSMANRIVSGISASISIFLYGLALGLLVYGILIIYGVVH
jgi:hypothetical protein